MGHPKRQYRDSRYAVNPMYLRDEIMLGHEL